jgi:hypothetical protein
VLRSELSSYIHIPKLAVSTYHSRFVGDPASIGYEDPVTDKRSMLVDTVMIELRNRLHEMGKLELPCYECL